MYSPKLILYCFDLFEVRSGIARKRMEQAKYSFYEKDRDLSFMMRPDVEKKIMDLMKLKNSEDSISTFFSGLSDDWLWEAKSPLTEEKKHYISEEMNLYAYYIGGGSDIYPFCPDDDFQMANDLLTCGAIDSYRAGRVDKKGNADWFFKGDLFSIILSIAKLFYYIDIKNDDYQDFLKLRNDLKKTGDLPMIEFFWKERFKWLSVYPEYIQSENFAFLDLMRRRVNLRWWQIGPFYPK